MLTQSSFFNFDPPPKPLVYPLDDPPNEIPEWCPPIPPPSQRIVLYWQSERDGCEMIPRGITHVAWGYAEADAHSSIVPVFQGNADTLRKCILSLRRRCIRSMVSIGGANNKLNLTKIRDPKKFAASVLQLVEDFKFDGVDVDDEVNTLDGFQKQHYLSYMKELYNVLKTGEKQYTLTTCAMVGEIEATCSKNPYERCFVPEVADLVDWVHVMAYNVDIDNEKALAKYKSYTTHAFLNFVKAFKSKEKLSIGFCLGKACAYGIGPPDDIVDSWTHFSRNYGGMMIYSGNQDIDHGFVHTRKVIEAIRED